MNKIFNLLIFPALIIGFNIYGQRLDAKPFDIKVFSGGIVDIDVSDEGVRENLEMENLVLIGQPPYDFGELDAWGGPFHNSTVTLADISGKTAVIQLCLTNCPPCIDLSNMFSMAFAGGGESYPNRWDLHWAYLADPSLTPRPTEIPNLQDLGDELVVLDALFVRELVGVENHSTREEAKLYFQFGPEGFVGRLWNNPTLIPDYLFPPPDDAFFIHERIHYDISFRESIEQFADLTDTDLTSSILPAPGALRGSDHISVLYDGSTEGQTGANYDMAVAYGGKPFPDRPFAPRLIYVDNEGYVRANVVGSSVGPFNGSRVKMAEILARRDVSELSAQDLIENAVDIIDDQPISVIPGTVRSDLLRHLTKADTNLDKEKTVAACLDLSAAGLTAENAYIYQVHPLADVSRPVITREEVTFEIIMDIADAIRKLPVPFNCGRRSGPHTLNLGAW